MVWRKIPKKCDCNTKLKTCMMSLMNPNPQDHSSDRSNTCISMYASPSRARPVLATARADTGHVHLAIAMDSGCWVQARMPTERKEKSEIDCDWQRDHVWKDLRWRRSIRGKSENKGLWWLFLPFVFDKKSVVYRKLKSATGFFVAPLSQVAILANLRPSREKNSKF